MQYRNLHSQVSEFINNMNTFQSNSQGFSRPHTQTIPDNAQGNLDTLWNKIVSLIINSCIESLPHFWVYEDKTINKQKKKKRVIPYKHTAKLSNLWLRITRIIS